MPDLKLEPGATGAGLDGAGQSRTAALAGGLPVLPVHQYVGGYATVATALIGDGVALLSGKVSAGLGLSTASVSGDETEEAANAARLTV